MSFGGSPPAMAVPPSPQVAPQMAPVTMKPPRKPSQTTAISPGVGAQQQADTSPRRTLIGGSSA